MIYQEVKQEVELWEAWIEYDPNNPEFFGILYVLGEVLAGQETRELIIRMDDEDQALSLRIPSLPQGKCRRKEVMYSEPIRNLNQYASIRIYSGKELITRFDEIEVLI